MLREGSLTVRALVESYLDRVAMLDPALHAFITVTSDEALKRASELDDELRSGRDRGPLHGIPIVHKDIFDTAGVRTTFGSGLFADRVPQTSADVVLLLDRAGVVVLGKTNMPEFATDPTGRNRAFGDLRHPIDRNRSGGGSSGGTAVAIAAGLCLGGTGSDTGGSIRIPASWCGVVGLRPTLGLVSVTGAQPRAPSLDAAGPLAANTRDCALLLNAMVTSGKNYALKMGRDCKGLRIGVLADLTGTDSQVVAAVSNAVARFEQLGVRSMSIQNAFLAGVDDEGLLDVLLYEFNEVLGDLYARTEDRENAFSPVVRANIARGRAVPKEQYDRELRLRPHVIADVRSLFEKVDAIVTPATETIAPPLEGNEEVYAATRRFTLPASFVGLPAISIPCGTNADGLPIGLQLIGDAHQEELLFQLASAFESTFAVPKGFGAAL